MSALRVACYIEGRRGFKKYEGMQPVYTEYNVGHYRAASPSVTGSINSRSEPMSAMAY
jgi:hypothetical protein